MRCKLWHDHNLCLYLISFIGSQWRILSSGLPLLRRYLKLRKEVSVPKSRSQNYNPFQPKALSSAHTPLYMPGRVIHIVKNYPKGMLYAVCLTHHIGRVHR